jgi:hypothetical protein
MMLLAMSMSSDAHASQSLIRSIFSPFNFACQKYNNSNKLHFAGKVCIQTRET